jgi:hypothetical protein
VIALTELAKKNVDLMKQALQCLESTAVAVPAPSSVGGVVAVAVAVDGPETSVAGSPGTPLGPTAAAAAAAAAGAGVHTPSDS